MDAVTELRLLLSDDRTVRLVEDGIHTVLPDVTPHHHYDKRASVYDLVVSTRLYNSVMWGSSPRDYEAFAQQAVVSSTGHFLDAGCGSLLFTAPIYLECDRRVIAFDQSLAMLRRARQRLMIRSGSMPEHVLLLQADLNDVPFRPGVFETALCLNVLHLFENAAALIPQLRNLLAREGQLYLTSLVSNNRFVGDRYLNALHSAGEFVRPRSSMELKEMVGKSFSQQASYSAKGNMAFITAAA